MTEDCAKPSNKLVYEKSPYLLQHARNPVAWYPWGDEAFEKARKEDKPIFLSIGYSTCHWCHVMERESFEDSATADLMNDNFVSIKVDREERPDIDDYYMTVCQLMTGSGGWPLTIIMTPDKKPFFAATYIPREGKFGRVGMLELIPRIKAVWTDRKGDIDRASRDIAAALRKIGEDASGEMPGVEILDETFRQLNRIYDNENAGFGGAPKFPTPHMMTFLLRYHKRTGDRDALRMVEKTLDSMDAGGIRDHLGNGFHRYSTDRRWLVPHFEKMLYDQALIAIAAIETYQTTGNEKYKSIAESIFEYVLRDMTDPGGGFHSAEDADSEGVEGKFYVWTTEEVRKILSEKESEIFEMVYGVEGGGNWYEESTTEKNGTNILHIEVDSSIAADRLNIKEEEAADILNSAREKLLNERGKRVRPLKDDKILVDWNGLMIAAMAMGAHSFDNAVYLEASSRAANFVLNNMMDENGRLLRRYRDGEAAIPAFLDDYAFFVWGLIELYGATFDVNYLEKALELNADMIEYFHDDQNGGFFIAAVDRKDLPDRKKEIYDGATPSGNSVAMLNMLRLGRITADMELEKKALDIVKAFSVKVKNNPVIYTQLLAALDFAIGPSYEVVIAGNPDADDTRSMVNAFRVNFIPNKVLILRPTGDKSHLLDKVAEYIKPLKEKDGKATAYVCSDFNCKMPVTEVKSMLKLLNST